MTTIRNLAALAGALAVAAPVAAFTPGIDAGASRYTIGISGFVPVICRASVNAGVVAPEAGRMQLGQLSEFCNSPNGYRVHADYSASLAKAKLYVDGKPVPLKNDGSTMVSQSSRAAIDSHALELELPKGTQAGSISFRIEPL